MGNSLQEQLLKSGLADKSTAKQARSEKRKKQKLQHKNVSLAEDEVALAAAKAMEEKRLKDIELNRQQQLEREKKALFAQAKQIIEINLQPKGKGETHLNVVEDSVIRRLLVSHHVHKQVIDGRLAVVRATEGLGLVPMPIADKIMERVPELVLYRADKQENKVAEQDDWYAEYKIPDDLMW